MIVGKEVTIINYGNYIWRNGELIDLHPELVGRKGVIIEEMELHGGEKAYKVTGVCDFKYWFNEKQLQCTI